MGNAKRAGKGLTLGVQGSTLRISCLRSNLGFGLAKDTNFTNKLQKIVARDIMKKILSSIWIPQGSTLRIGCLRSNLGLAKLTKKTKYQ